MWLAPGRRAGSPGAELPGPAALAALTGESLPRPDAAADAPAPAPVSLVVGVGALDDGAEGSPGTREAWETAAGWADVGRGLTLAPEPGVGPVEVVRTWERLGVDPGRVGDVGLTAAGPHDPTVLRTLRRDAEELAARLAELRG